MKKILAFIMVTALAMAMVSGISAQLMPIKIIEQPGAPIVNDYCVHDWYPIGTFSLAHSQTASFTIPATACPPLKKGPLWGIMAFVIPIGQLTDISFDTDSAVRDAPQYQYNCYYNRPCDCVIPPVTPQVVSTNGVLPVELCSPRQLRICANARIDTLGVQFYTGEGEYFQQLTDQYETDGGWCAFFELPSEIIRMNITNGTEGSVQGEVSIYECCCYDCYKQKALPTTLYPKIDIETFSVPSGPTVIQDGKVISKFEMSPGSQQVLLQVENRGFFTQNDTRLRFDGLPEGITVQVTPETQKIKAHNIGTYSANFTVGSNVPSGTYQVTMVAYSPNGMFDKITFEFVVQ